MDNKYSQKEKPTILLVDDDAVIRQTLNDILQIDGYNIVEVSDGKNLISVIKNIDVDVILLDINLPGMSGLEITKILKSDNDLMHIPVVIVTGENDLQLRIKALKLGADDFIVKPPHFAELSARIKTLVKVKAYNDHMKNSQYLLEKQVSLRTKQLQKALERLKNSSLDTIYRLSRAAEYRDEDTSAHLLRMSNYAASLAEKLGMPKDQVDTILYTSPMHDIGKIGVPDSILLKTGKLDENEWELMKTHTVIGSKILEDSSSPLLIKGHLIALTHHEKWDGSGYPNGLSGKDIPLEGRISAVADVFDALTSKRTYKEAFSQEKAYQIIKEGSGSHFDPEMVSAFLSIKNIIANIKKKFEG